MNKQASTTQVLICGAGAAGLTLAIDLARRGVAIRLIDKLPAPFAGSRGKGIQPRTLEVLEDLGVVDRLAAVGAPYPVQRLHKADGTFTDSQEVMILPPTADEPYRTPLMVPQFRTEAVLRERLAELGGAVEYGRELTGFDQEAEGVTATVAGPDGVETIRCRYMVGGDGGRSFVRHALDIGFPGKTLGVRAVVADIELDGLSRDVWHRCGEGDMDRQIGLCPLAGTNLFQLQAPIPLEGDVDLSVAGLQAFIDARWTVGRLTVRRVAWASAYHMNARLADRYRVGRVLLMGDAAHIHPPTGAQGMNTGIQDAHNLAWKLALAVRGAAADGLLSTSSPAERRPVGEEVVGRTVRSARAGIGADSDDPDYVVRREAQLLISYADSPIVGAGAGGRAPDARGLMRSAITDPIRLFTLFGREHTLLLYAGDAAAADAVAGLEATADAAVRAAHGGLDVYLIAAPGAGIDATELPVVRDAAGEFAAAYVPAGAGVFVVRPDGYFGFADRHGSDAGLLKYLQATFR